jgi:rubrerythrin
MEERQAVLDILQKAYQIEVDGYAFYSMTAERSDKPAVQELFDKLASDEVQHQAFLKDIAGKFGEKGAAAFHLNLRSSDWRAINQAMFTAHFREQAAGAQFELGVLSIGMTLESNAIAYFTGAAKQSAEAEVQGFYRFLADWEKQHLEALRGLHEVVRADHFAVASFTPF